MANVIQRDLSRLGTGWSVWRRQKWQLKIGLESFSPVRQPAGEEMHDAKLMMMMKYKFKTDHKTRTQSDVVTN